MIEVERLSKSYGGPVLAVSSVSFTVKKGEVVGFLGPNGAGKSTTLRMVAGFLGATAGKIRVNGHDIVDEPMKARASTGYMPEAVPLYPEMRVSEYLRFRAELKGVPRRDRAAALDRAMEQARITDVAETLIGHLSKGYRQRVGLADALCARPPILILDEPTAGLDPNQIREMRRLVRELGKEHAVLLSTHILPEVEASCDRALVIARGKLVAQGTLEELKRLRRAKGVRVVLGSSADLDRAAALVGAIGGVESARRDGDALLVTWKKDVDDVDPLAEEVARAIVGAGMGLRELSPSRASLEEVFTELTTVAPSEAGEHAVKGFWPIFKRELFSLFVTPTAWILILVFLLIQGFHFFILVSHFANNPEMSIDQGPVQAFFGEFIIPYLLAMLLCPGITMRLFAEERRSGTIETLLTAPASTPAVVLGKFAAAVTTYAAMWLPTLLYMVVLARGGDVDWHVVATGYAGVMLTGAGYLALGTLMSAMTTSQLVAIVLSTLAILGMFVLGIGEMVFPSGPVHDVSAYISAWAQMGELSKGVVDLRRIVFDVSLIALPLFITVRAVDAWRWG